ncbi:hypothetical protein NIES2130_24585 [Scytonema sp. HK-05]|nr:hypothetical protein NIES2130_24585 [Scytonema sp. HK-05]
MFGTSEDSKDSGYRKRDKTGERAFSTQISPLQLSFTGTPNVVRRAISKFQRIEPEEIPFFNLAYNRNS